MFREPLLAQPLHAQPRNQVKVSFSVADGLAPSPGLPPPQKGDHYHLDDGQDAINNIYACGLIEEINIEPEQDPADPSKINIKVVVEEVKPKSVQVGGRKGIEAVSCSPFSWKRTAVPKGVPRRLVPASLLSQSIR